MKMDESFACNESASTNQHRSMNSRRLFNRESSHLIVDHFAATGTACQVASRGQEEPFAVRIADRPLEYDNVKNVAPRTIDGDGINDDDVSALTSSGGDFGGLSLQAKDVPDEVLDHVDVDAPSTDHTTSSAAKNSENHASQDDEVPVLTDEDPQSNAHVEAERATSITPSPQTAELRPDDESAPQHPPTPLCADAKRETADQSFKAEHPEQPARGEEPSTKFSRRVAAAIVVVLGLGAFAAWTFFAGDSAKTTSSRIAIESGSSNFTQTRSSDRKDVPIPFWEVRQEVCFGLARAPVERSVIPFWELEVGLPEPRTLQLKDKDAPALVPLWRKVGPNAMLNSSDALQVVGSADENPDSYPEWVQSLALALSGLLVGLAYRSTLQGRCRVESVSLASSAEESASVTSPSCQCSSTLRVFENLMEFHESFQPCGKGRKWGSPGCWKQYPESYCKLTLPELALLLNGLDPLLRTKPATHYKSSKLEKVAMVYQRYHDVLQGFTKAQLFQLIEQKGIAGVQQSAVKDELVQAALQAGF